jgi:glucosamine--fructose-6-phosphate aminotransferase (isomerizing)
MCGIVGYIGYRQAQTVLMNNLKHLEYRGYDSCGIAIRDSKISIYKDAIRINELAKISPKIKGTIGIGHTRWATCGIPSKENAHPHSDCSGKTAIVHNGVIFNYEKLKKKLEQEGHTLSTQTDSEVLAHLIENNRQKGIKQAVEAALREVEGSYALIVLDEDSEKLLAARKESPLVIGLGEREYFIASDVPALLEYTDRVVYLQDGDTAEISKSALIIINNGQNVTRKEQKICWGAEDIRKGGFEHFMIKEIHEQPLILRNTLLSYSRVAEEIDILNDGEYENILILACGTSYYAGLIGKYIIEELMRIPVKVEIASEFNSNSMLGNKTLVIAMSQSGETADVLKAVKLAKRIGHNVLAVTNVLESTLSRLADDNIYTKAGPEISVASTKTFIAQLSVLYWLALANNKINTGRIAELKFDISKIPNNVQKILSNKKEIEKCGKYLARYENVFYIGRGVNYPIALEGALKLKEVSYIHAEGYAAGELKHGPFALLGVDTPVVVVLAHDENYEVMLNSIREIKARNSPVIAICASKDVPDLIQIADVVIDVPYENPILSPFYNCVVLQLLAYYAAKQRGCSIDYPKNLAKSVTVE